MPDEKARKDWLLLLVLILLLAFAFQGSRGLWRPDEGRYVRCAYEMLKTGEWITPQINYKPHFTKPPVTYWLIASGLSLFGMNEWGARFFHAVAFALTAGAVGLLARRMWGHKEGVAAGLIYATSLTPFIAGNVITADTIVTCLETLAVLSFWMGSTAKPAGPQRLTWMAAMWAFLGLAFLTKGPPGLLPLGVIAVFLVIGKDARRPSAGWLVAGIALFAAIALPWYVVVVRRHEGLLSYFVMSEFIGRFFTGEYNRNTQWFGPLRVYFPILTAGALPWAFLWPTLLRLYRPAPFTAGWWKRLRSRPKALFLGLWFLLPLLVFTVSKSRLPLYVLPLFAPLALVTAYGLVHYILPKSYRRQKMHVLAVGSLTLFLLFSKFMLAHVTVDKDTRAMWNGIRNLIYEKAGGAPFEIVAAYSNYDGLAFYSDGDVECLGSGRRTAPSYIPEEAIDEEYEELPRTDYLHVFLVAENHKRKVLSELQKRGVDYSLGRAPFGHTLIFCDNARSPQQGPVTRLAVLGDSGTGDANQTLLGSTLYHLTQNASLDAILLAGDNVVGWNGDGDATSAYRHYFEEPYAGVLGVGVPFYAALGNHDLGHIEYQTRYPLFHMQARRYYSKVFGPNRVQAFFLDSNTLAKESPQIAWLTRALRESTAVWKIIVMHHPMYSTARHRGTNPDKVALLEPIFIATGVDIVVYGHNHVYERLRPIHGIQYMTMGSSGKLNRHDLVPEAPLRVAGNDEDNVLLTLHFTDERCRIIAYTINEKIVDEAEIEQHRLRNLTDSDLEISSSVF